MGYSLLQIGIFFSLHILWVKKAPEERREEMEDARFHKKTILGFDRPIRVIAFITLWAFIFSNIPSEFLLERVWAKPDAQNNFRQSAFLLPYYLGDVEDSWLSKNSTNTVIHIQDAHCNYAAQKQIAKIIDYLSVEHGIRTINLEGGKGEYDLSVFTDIKDVVVRKKASDYFVREGLVSGAEYFAVNNPGRVRLWGVEDTDLYIENLSIYRSFILHKKRIDTMVQAINDRLDALKPKIFSSELLSLDEKRNQYKDKVLELKDYIGYLGRANSSVLINKEDFPNLVMLQKIFDTESDVDFKKANIERGALVGSLQKVLSSVELKELVEKSIEFKSEEISEKDYYNYLTKKAVSINVDLAGFPELQKYFSYVSQYEKVNKLKIHEELKNLESEVASSFYLTDQEKELDTLCKNFVIFENLLDFTITNNDYAYYKANPERFDVGAYVEFINKTASMHELSRLPDENVGKINGYKKEAEKFYVYSFKRDEAFLENIKFSNNWMDSESANISVLVTGGFHTENLKMLFEKRGISYISIMPKFKNNESYKCPYFEVLSGKNNVRVKDALPSVINGFLGAPSQLNRAIDLAVGNLSAAPILAETRVAGELQSGPA